MANSKHVIGFEDNLAKPLQNYAPTMYAIRKMRAGRTPKYPDGTIITAEASPLLGSSAALLLNVMK